MRNVALLAMFAIIVVGVGSVTFAGLTTMSSAVAQEYNGTMAGNPTLGSPNMTDTNMTNGTGNISGVEDPF